MIALARLADKGPLMAGSLAAGLLLAALWIPAIVVSSGAYSLVFFVSLLSTACLVVSASVVAFVALRHSEVSALRVVGGCLLLLIVVSTVLYGSAWRIPTIVVICWLPAIVAAVVLARSVRLDYAVLTVVAFGVLSVLIQFIALGDPSVFWLAQFGDSGSAASLPEVAGVDAALLEQQRLEVASVMANMMTGAVGVSVMNIALGALFLARFWQAALINVGGFQKEFHALSLGKNVSLVGLLVILLTFFVGGQFAIAIAVVVIFAFFLQGLAVAHALVKQRGMHRFWLHGIYVLLVVPHTSLLIAALGMADNMFSLRNTEKQ